MEQNQNQTRLGVTSAQADTTELLRVVNELRHQGRDNQAEVLSLVSGVACTQAQLPIPDTMPPGMEAAKRIVKEEKKRQGARLTTWIMLFLLFFTIPKVVYAAEIKEDDAVRAIVGEAANQGKEGMLAVACAIRNRGTLKGVYGKGHEEMLNKQPKWVWDRARAAWRESATKDVTNGATHWENVNAFGTPTWAKGMQITVVVKDHRFYKPKTFI